MEKDCVVSYLTVYHGIPSGEQVYGIFTRKEAEEWLISKGFEPYVGLWLRNEGKFIEGVAKIFQIKAP